MKQRMVVGGAEAIAEQLKTKVFDAGVDGVILNLPTNIQGYQPGHITALGAALRPLVARLIPQSDVGNNTAQPDATIRASGNYRNG